MDKKSDAYARFYSGRDEDIIKCDNCGFRAVKMQFDDVGGCPKCEGRTEKEQRGMAKGKSIQKGHYK